jgi:hypothetical protein
MDCMLDLVTTCIHHTELHFVFYWHTQTSVLGLLQSPLAVSWQRYLPRDILQLPVVRFSCNSHPCRTHVNRQPSANWVLGWRPFHTNLEVFSSQADFQLNWQLNCLIHQPAASRHFTQLNCWTLSFTNQLLHVTSLNWTAEPSHSPTSYFTSLHSTELLNSLIHQPATSRHFAPLNCWHL